jgi:hypothetical protein
MEEQYPNLVWKAEINMSPEEYHSFLFSDPLDEFIWGENGMGIGRFEKMSESPSPNLNTPGERVVKLYPDLGSFSTIVSTLRLYMNIEDDVHYFSTQKKYPKWIKEDEKTHIVEYENKFPMFETVTLNGVVDVQAHETDPSKCIHSMTCKFKTERTLLMRMVEWPMEKVIGSEVQKYVQKLPGVIDSFSASQRS